VFRYFSSAFKNKPWAGTSVLVVHVQTGVRCEKLLSSTLWYVKTNNRVLACFGRTWLFYFETVILFYFILFYFILFL